jgi:hypothetical protein
MREGPSSLSCRASNSLSSLGQPIPSRYPFAFRHPARGGSLSSTGSPPFAFSWTTTTPQVKRTSTCVSRKLCSMGNAETATTSSPSGGSPVSAAPPSSSASSLREHAVECPCLHAAQQPTRPHASVQAASQFPRLQWVATSMQGTSPSSPSSTCTRQLSTTPRIRLRRRSSATLRSTVTQWLALSARARRFRQPLVPSSQPSPRVTLLGSRNGSAALLARISGAFRSRSRSRYTSSGSEGTDSGTGAGSRHNSLVSAASVSLGLGLGLTQAQSRLIHSIGGASSRCSIELVPGAHARFSRCRSVVWKRIVGGVRERGRAE